MNLSLDSCVGRFFIQIFFWILVKKCPTHITKFGFVCRAFFHVSLSLFSRFIGFGAVSIFRDLIYGRKQPVRKNFSEFSACGINILFVLPR